MAKKFRALGAYIFAGGFTVGVKKHFDVDTHFEHGPYGTETALGNGLVKSVFTDPATWPIAEYAKSGIDFIYGNPACAPWSLASAGRELHWTEDPRVNMVRRMVSLLERIRPKVWAWESVRPTFVKGRALVNTIAEYGMRRGYNATVLMVDGQYHGVAQVRKRMFLVLHKVPIIWEMGDREEAMTVKEAWKGLPKKPCTFIAAAGVDRPYMRSLKPGERAQAAYDRLNPGKKVEGEVCRGRPGFLKFRLTYDEPSRVLLGGAHLFHPKENRYISVEESAALCGYPRGFTFDDPLSKTNRGTQYAQVAQAVMPPVAEYLARMVRKGLESGRRVTKPQYERVEIFGDRVEREPLNRALMMTDGLKLVPEAPAKPPRVAKDGKPRGPARLSGQGIGAYIRSLLQTGAHSTNEIITAVKRKFPQSKATAADVSWNRRKLAGKE